MVDALQVAALAYPSLKLPGRAELGQLARVLAAAQEAADLPVQARPGCIIYGAGIPPYLTHRGLT